MYGARYTTNIRFPFVSWTAISSFNFSPLLRPHGSNGCGSNSNSIWLYFGYESKRYSNTQEWLFIWISWLKIYSICIVSSGHRQKNGEQNIMNITRFLCESVRLDSRPVHHSPVTKLNEITANDFSSDHFHSFTFWPRSRKVNNTKAYFKMGFIGFNSFIQTSHPSQCRL